MFGLREPGELLASYSCERLFSLGKPIVILEELVIRRYEDLSKPAVSTGKEGKPVRFVVWDHHDIERWSLGEVFACVNRCDQLVFDLVQLVPVVSLDYSKLLVRIAARLVPGVTEPKSARLSKLCLERNQLEPDIIEIVLCDVVLLRVPGYPRLDLQLSVLGYLSHPVAHLHRCVNQPRKTIE